MTLTRLRQARDAQIFKIRTKDDVLWRARKTVGGGVYLKLERFNGEEWKQTDVEHFTTGTPTEEEWEKMDARALDLIGHYSDLSERKRIENGVMRQPGR